MKRIAITCLILATMLAAAAAPVTITAKLDSATLLMGKTTPLHIEVVQDRGVNGIFPVDHIDTLNAMVEIADRLKADTTDLGNNRIQINRDLILQSFDSGMYSIGPIAYIVGGDTFFTRQMTLKVLPVHVDSLQDIHDLKPVEEVPFKFFDWVPDIIADWWWAWLLAVLLIAGAVYYYRHWYKKGINPLKPVRKRLPAYDEAMLNLQNLKQRQLWQNGQEKEYFTGLTDILRVYIDRRFHVNAVEMTSTQIIETLKQNDETRAVNEQLSMILEIADFVKFAGARPLADDNEMAFQRAVQFVEVTKPVSTPTEDDGREVQS